MKRPQVFRKMDRIRSGAYSVSCFWRPWKAPNAIVRHEDLPSSGPPWAFRYGICPAWSRHVDSGTESRRLTLLLMDVVQRRWSPGVFSSSSQPSLAGGLGGDGPTALLLAPLSDSGGVEDCLVVGLPGDGSFADLVPVQEPCLHVSLGVDLGHVDQVGDQHKTRSSLVTVRLPFDLHGLLLPCRVDAAKHPERQPDRIEVVRTQPSVSTPSLALRAGGLD